MAGLGAYSQITWPGVGKIDDCGVIATFWALVAAGIVTQTGLGTVSAFRIAGGRAADNSGIDNADILKALNKLFPQAGATAYRGGIAGFTKALKAGYVASLAVNSAMLPAYLQFGFKGLHQVSVIYQKGQFYVMNPLAVQDSPLLLITAADLLRAAAGFAGAGMMSAILIKWTAGKVPTSTKTTVKPKPAIPRSPRYIPIVKNYIYPTEARGFYNEMHKPTDPLTGGLD